MMIASLIMIAGGLAALFGLGFTVYILVTPILVKIRSINGEGELIETAKVRRIRIKDRKDLLHISVCILVTGLMVFGAGYYLGFAAKGDGFWFYRLVNGTSADSWDRVDEQGQYVADDGSTYRYFIRISGDKYDFCGEKCENADALREKLQSVRGGGNTVMVADNYAVSSAFREVTSLLDEMGIKYTTENV
ncbi:MAG: hypothetical protein IJ149_03675 [Oscillospiraceae bacterium]|nr:hypothetical protein [Oscillospiraceae bacterium]